MKMLIKALLFLWIGTTSEDQQGVDLVTDILMMKPPFIPTGAMANVSKFGEAHQGGDGGRRDGIENPTKEEPVIQEQPLGTHRHSGKFMMTLEQEPTVTMRSINTSGQVEEDQRGEVRVDDQPCDCAADCQQGRAGRSQAYQGDQDVSQGLEEVRRVRVEASKVIDEAKKVQEEDRSRQNRAGYFLVFGYSINAALEPIGIAFLEDVFSGMERAWKRFTAWATSIEGYMGGYSWPHLFPNLYGAGSSSLPCSSQDLDRVLDAFERDIPFIKTTAQATLAIGRLKSQIPVAIGCILYDKNEYAEVVRVLQVVEDLIEAYIKVLQVPAASGSAVSTTEDEDFYYEELANEYKKLPGLHLSATSKVEAFNAYKNSMTYIGALLNHFGTAGKCALGVLVTHDVFSERIANASSPEEARWEQIKMVISDVTLTGGCLSAGYAYAQTLINQMEPYKIKCGSPLVLQAVLQKYRYMARPRELVRRTGSVNAAQKYVRRFDQDLDVALHCIFKEEAGVQFKNSFKMYNHLVLAGLGLF